MQIEISSRALTKKTTRSSVHSLILDENSRKHAWGTPLEEWGTKYIADQTQRV